MNSDQKHRILFIEPAGNLWGSERSLYSLLTHLDLNAVQPVVCLPKYSSLGQKAIPSGITLHPCLDAGFKTRSAFSRLRNAFALFCAISRFHPDSIHINQAGFLKIVRLANLFHRKPVVIHVRLGTDAAFVARNAPRKTPFICIAISQFVADALHHQGIPKVRIQKVINPIEVPPKPVDRNPVPTEPIVGFVGRTIPDKGILCFIEAMRLLCQQHAGIRAEIIGDAGGVIHSDGSDFLEHCKRIVENQSGAERIQFLGFHPNPVERMPQFSVLAVPSELEAWGRVVAEAMSVGVPVVGSDVGGIPEIIQHGVNGYLFPVNDAQALAEAILKIMTDDEIRSRMSKQSRQWVRSQCDPDQHAQKVVNIHAQLINESKLHRN